MSDLITPPLDPTRPLWHVYLIEGFGEGCALLFRIHHCIADGIALARVMLSLTDAEPDVAIAPAPPAPPRGAGGRLGALTRPATGALTAGRRMVGAVAHEGIETLLHPQHAAHLAATAGRDTGTLAKLLTAPPDTHSPLSGPLHGSRRVAWSTPFPLDRVKRAGRRGATINDVLVAGLTGALHTYLTDRDSSIDELHIMVPFNLRPLDKPLPRHLGNDFGLILLALPVGLMDPGERLREVKLRMDAIKDSHEGPIAYGMLERDRPDPADRGGSTDLLFQQQGERRGHERARPARARLLRRQPCAGRARLGPLLGQHGNDREHLQLPRRGDRGLHGGHRPGARPAAARCGIRRGAEATLSRNSYDSTAAGGGGGTRLLMAVAPRAALTSPPLSLRPLAERLDGYVERAQAAATSFRELNQEQVDRIVWAMVVAGLRNAVELAQLAHGGDRLRRVRGQVVKNYIATEFLYDYLKDKRSVGVIDEDPERGIEYVAEPIGVVLALTPITNPTSTVLFRRSWRRRPATRSSSGHRRAPPLRRAGRRDPPGGRRARGTPARRPPGDPRPDA